MKLRYSLLIITVTYATVGIFGAKFFDFVQHLRGGGSTWAANAWLGVIVLGWIVSVVLETRDARGARCAVLDLYARREGRAQLELVTADGPLRITFPWRVDAHEITKARACGNAKRPWREVLDAVSDVVDCSGADVTGPPM